MKFVHRLREALTKDTEAVPLRFPRAAEKVTASGPGRLPALAELLEEMRDRDTAVLFLTELIDKTRRQVGAELCLHTTFANRFSEIRDSTFKALPGHAQQALTRIVDMGNPFPASDALLLAHCLTVDGELCALIAGMSGEPEKPKETPEQAYRRIQMKVHPDRGGSAAASAAVSELWKAFKQEQTR